MTERNSWGASPSDWQHFAETLDLLPDLLPVVSNAHAEISPESKMKAVGKTPSRYNKQRLAVGFPNWTTSQANEKRVALWASEPDYGICLQTRQVRAIDVDIADIGRAQEVAATIELLVGRLPCRWRGNSGKFLLAFRMPGDYSKRVLRTEHGNIEFLATGQQFVAVGMHPSGQRYRWGVCGDDTGVGEDALPAEIPYLSREEFEALWSALETTHAVGGSTTRVRSDREVQRRLADDAAGDPILDYLQRNGWVLSGDAQGRAHIRCPWDAEHSDAGDGSESATTYFPAGVGGFAQGHFRCLHAHCEHRTDGDFLEAVGYSADGFDVVPTRPGGEQDAPKYMRDRQGRIEPTITNVVMALRREDQCGARLAFDRFQGTLMVAEGGRWRAFSDHDYTQLRITLERHDFKAVGREMVRDAVTLVAQEQQFDSAQDWLKAQTWDGVLRRERFFPDYFGTADTPYARACGRYIWSALASRVLDPGHKVDMVPILIGPEGVRKSTGVAMMAPTEEAFTTIKLGAPDDQLARRMRGKLVGELGELRGLNTTDGESIRDWITRTVEEWTPKYMEYGTRWPRRTVFIGTSNPDDPLPEGEEGRRWLPLRVLRMVDTAAIRRDCAQLWAEGAQAFREHGVEFNEAEERARSVRDEFRRVDPWHGRIVEWLNGPLEGVDAPDGGPRRRDGLFRMEDLMQAGIGLSIQLIGIKDQKRVAAVLQGLGMESARVRSGGIQFRVWGAKEACENAQIRWNLQENTDS